MSLTGRRNGKSCNGVFVVPTEMDVLLGRRLQVPTNIAFSHTERLSTASSPSLSLSRLVDLWVGLRLGCSGKEDSVRGGKRSCESDDRSWNPMRGADCHRPHRSATRPRPIRDTPTRLGISAFAAGEVGEGIRCCRGGLRVPCAVF